MGKVDNTLGNMLHEQMRTLHELSECAAQPEHKFKYKEDAIVADFLAYLNQTYGEHYKSADNRVECFDAWISLGDATPTFRNTAIKYLWRYGKKKQNVHQAARYDHVVNKNDLWKAMHYVLMCLYNDFYRMKGE